MKEKSFVFLSHTVASRAKIYVFLPIAPKKAAIILGEYFP